VMIASVEDFVRDIEAIPEQGLAFIPPGGDGEAGWPVAKLIGHIASTRGYFVSAFLDEGWIAPPEPAVTSLTDVREALHGSAALVRERLAGQPDSVLARRIRLIDAQGDI